MDLQELADAERSSSDCCRGVLLKMATKIFVLVAGSLAQSTARARKASNVAMEGPLLACNALALYERLPHPLKNKDPSQSHQRTM